MAYNRRIGDPVEPVKTDNHELKWSVHLARKEPGKAIALFGVAILAGLLGVLLVGNPWMFPFGVIVIFLGTADFALPVSYRIDEEGARLRTGLSVTAIEWDKVRRVVEGPDGIKLSPLETSSRLAPFRGIFLRADGNLQEIRTCVEYWRERHASLVGETTHGRGQDEDNRASGDRDPQTEAGDPGNAVPRDA